MIFLYMGSFSKMKDDFKFSMMNEFEMKYLGLMKYFLGMKVYEGKYINFICKKRYVKDMLKKFDMADNEPLSTRISH